MPFQVPPTLPDYKKLTFMLNSSGVQKWNPAMYDILNKLIEAVSQSQDVVVNSIIPTAIPSSGGVVVDPLGALDGVGTTPSPLAVRVDGTTVQINGLDQLTAPGTSPFQLFQLTFNLVHPTVIPLNSAPIVVAPAVVGAIGIPIWWSQSTHKNGSWTNGGSPFQLAWTNFAGLAVNINNLTSGYGGAGILDTFAFASGYNQTITAGSPLPTNQNLVITSNADITSTPGASSITTIQVAYVYVAG